MHTSVVRKCTLQGINFCCTKLLIMLLGGTLVSSRAVFVTFAAGCFLFSFTPLTQKCIKVAVKPVMAFCKYTL